MRLKNLIAYLFLGFVATSCIQDEAPNAEADIESCTVPGDVLNREPVIENNKITLYVKKKTDVSALPVEFTLTPGATISPKSGTARDFSTPQSYTVTSEDRQWTKSYTVEVSQTGFTNATYHFENATKKNGTNYLYFYETDENGKETMAWASGNPGYALTGALGNQNTYPTYQSDNGYTGKCLALTTRRTGSLGNSVNMPLASGNLFIGTFDVLNALQNALTSTRFGMQFEYIPTNVKGYYKYQSGETFYELDKSAKDKLRPVPGKKDIFDIYAVFYESTTDMETLDGTNVLSEDNPNIIAVARIDDAEETGISTTSQWKEFNLPFTYRSGKTIDPEKLKSGKYNLTIVFASSIRGDHFEGAPNSTLLIDEVKLGYIDNEE
nr:PCMD domain-containing protein [uncultured Bacteroides sp.]